MTPRKNVGDISRKNLESHGVYYDEELYHPPYILPEHVDVVREILLSFSGTVPRGGWEETLRQEALQYVSNEKNYKLGPEAVLPPNTSLVSTEDYEADLNDRSPEWRVAYENLKSCRKVAKIACNLGPDSEDGWVHFWRSHTFTVASEKAREQPGFHDVLDNWSLEGNCTWTEFPNLNSRNTNLARRTRPKPDLTYAFPILNKSFNKLRGFERDDFTKAFSAQSLGTLTQKKIICTPTTGLRNWMKTPHRTFLGSADLACFPWAVVEFKREPRPGVSLEERCYCQAANASAAALDLRTQLLTDDDACSTVPPVIAFTCVGHIVKVWLTYSEAADPRNHNTQIRRMICIWSTSMKLTWGVVMLQGIVMNMHTWASRLLKPRIQASVVQALRTPYIRHSKPLTPDVDIASSGLFDSPAMRVEATSNHTPLGSTSTAVLAENINSPAIRSEVTSNHTPSCSTPTAVLDENTSPFLLCEKQPDVTSEPTSPLPARFRRPIRRIATPRTRRLSPWVLERIWQNLTPTRTTSSGGLASVDTEQCAAVSTTSSPNNSTKNMKGGVDSADIDHIAQAMKLSQLDDSPAKSSTQHYDTNNPHSEASEDGQNDGQTPEPHRRFEHNTETYHTSYSAAQQVGALPHSDQPTTVPPMAPPVTSVLDSSPVWSASLSADNIASGTLPRRTVPRLGLFQYRDTLRQEKNDKTKSLSPQHTFQTVPNSHEYVIEARFSSCLRTLVEHKARMLKLLETLESKLEQGADIPLQIVTTDQTKCKTSNDSSDEKAPITTNTANHVRRASASSGSNDTNQKCTSDKERSTRSEKGSNYRRHSGSRFSESGVLYKGSTNDSNSDSEKQRDGAGKDEPEIGEEDFTKCEFKRKSHGEASEGASIQSESQEGANDSASEGDSEASEETFSRDESEEYVSRPSSNHNSDAVERDFNQDETGESGIDSEPDSDVEDDANSVSTDVRNVTEDDIAWVIGLGSLNGYQLARTPYLRELFISRTPDEQLSMIRTVLGAGVMAGDRYHWFDEEDLLDDLVKEIKGILGKNFFFINRKAFINQEGWIIRVALRRMAGPEANAQVRWRCFRKALAMRSQGVCAALLCSESFNFSEYEWATLENSAKHAAEAYYSPTQVEWLLGRQFSVQ
ncbi:Nn.00g032300.m01.CDS01 [Neocucurbitaria sp. VM-36]